MWVRGFRAPLRRLIRQTNDATKTGKLKKQSAGLMRSELPLEPNEEMRKNTETSESSRSSHLLRILFILPPFSIARLFVHFASGSRAALNTEKVKFAVTALTDASTSEVFLPFHCGNVEHDLHFQTTAPSMESFSRKKRKEAAELKAGSDAEVRDGANQCVKTSKSLTQPEKNPSSIYWPFLRSSDEVI